MADHGRGRRHRGRGRGLPVELPPAPVVATAAPPVGTSRSANMASTPTQEIQTLSLSGAGDLGMGRGRGNVRSGRSSYIEGQQLNTRPDCAKNSKKGCSGQKTTFQANYFELINRPDWSLNRYHVDFIPAEDRTRIRKIFIREHRESLGMYLFDGSTLFSIHNICPNGKPREFVSRRLSDQEEIQITIKFTGTVEKSDDQYYQIMNIIFRDCMRKMQLQLIKRNYYDKEARVQIREYKLELWPGYITAMSQCEQSILLQTEIIYKTLRQDTAYDCFREITQRSGDRGYRDEFCAAIIGIIVMTRYNDKTYRIDDVDFTKTPLDTFPQRTRDGEQQISYRDYYEQKYNIRIRDQNQPMLISKIKTDPKLKTDPDQNLPPQFVCLVPELCVMTGLNDTMRSNYSLMKAVADHTAVGPSDRIRRLEEFRGRFMSNQEVRQKLTDWGLTLGEKLVTIEGRILPHEKIVVGGNKTFMPGPDLDWTRNLRDNPLLLPAKLSRWVIIFPSDLRTDAKNLMDMIVKCGRGMSFNVPSAAPFVIENDRASAYVQGIEEAINSHNPELLVIILPNNRSDRYSAIKKKTIIDRCVPSQVVLMKNIRAKSAMSIATKITVQINCKIGGAPWGVDIPAKSAMVVGFDVCHDPKDKRRSFGAMVASLDSSFGRFYSTINSHASGDELSASFGPNMKKAVAKYQLRNDGKLPAQIILYRDGVGDGDLANVYEIEVRDIKKALEPVYKAKGQPLKLAVIIVTKRINTRIFYNRKNPPPGTVIDDVITNRNRFDFFLVSQSVRVGTVSPTHYNVIHDTINWSVDNYQRLTYKLCYMYYNWSGTIKVPAPCQYAHKLALLTSQNIGVAHANLDELLYFL